jgi:hypothetical protein
MFKKIILLLSIIKKSLHKIQDILSFPSSPLGTCFEKWWIAPKIKGIPIKSLELQSNLNIIILSSQLK